MFAYKRTLLRHNDPRKNGDSAARYRSDQADAPEHLTKAQESEIGRWNSPSGTLSVVFVAGRLSYFDGVHAMQTRESSNLL